jgi:hypothetical protein
MEKISVTRALGQLKLLDKKITKAVQAGNFSNYKVGGKSYIDKYTPVSDLQSVEDLIKQRAKLKTAIMVSNSVTVIKIGDKAMKVIEAIETKDSIQYRKLLLRKMKNDVAVVEQAVDTGNQEVQVRLDKMLISSYGRDVKPTGTEIETISKPFLDKNGLTLDHNEKIIDCIRSTEDEIDVFEAEVDLVLSESNAITLIKI